MRKISKTMEKAVRRRSRVDGFRGQRGVAMVTVLLVGASLTVVGSVAAFSTVREFRASSDDRRAAAALSYAEAGIDRFMLYLKSGLITYNDMNRAGCQDPALALPPGSVGEGTYEASMTVYDPDPASQDPTDRFPKPPTGGACASRPDSPHPGQGGDQTYFAITSRGRHPAATRVIRQVIAVEPLNLPVGLYARGISIQSAQHPFSTVSMISEQGINNRSNISFLGDDPYYFLSDFFGSVEVVGRDLSDPVPAAAHSITGNVLGKNTPLEFATDTKNCTANGTNQGGIASQSLWDSDGTGGPMTSGCAGQTGFPNSSQFTEVQLDAFAQPELSAQDHEVLKEAAKAYGVYCSFPGQGGSGGVSCIKQGAVVDSPTTATYASLIQSVSNGPPATPSFIAYIEFRSGNALTDPANNIGEEFTVWDCDFDPDLNRSVVLIVRNGGVNYTGAAGMKVNGAFILDGHFDVIGGFDFNGTIIAKGELRINSSSQKFSLDDCWVNNMPGPFLRTVPGQWSEIDR